MSKKTTFCFEIWTVGRWVYLGKSVTTKTAIRKELAKFNLSFKGNTVYIY